MPEVAPLSNIVLKKAQKYQIKRELLKTLQLLKENPKHPSLHVELLEPKKYAIWSFRIDRKFRALFIMHKDKQIVEILAITVHYH